jgi:hypothetical protein
MHAFFGTCVMNTPAFLFYGLLKSSAYESREYSIKKFLAQHNS